MNLNPSAITGKSKVKILVVSDSHGSQSTLKRIIKKFGSICDLLCFCGDGVQDLFSIIEESAYDSTIKDSLPENICFVQGNGDQNSYNLALSSENISLVSVPMNHNISICDMNIMLCHGHEYDVYYGMDNLYNASIASKANLVLFGHTHLSNVQTKYGVTLLNPGSCARPRGGTPHTLAIVTLEQETHSIEWNYYKMDVDENRHLNFNLYTPHEGELNLLW